MEVDNYYGGAMRGGENGGINGRRRMGNAAATGDPPGKAEVKRKRRLAKYKSYERERKVKSAIKKGFRWLKRKIEKIAHKF